MSYLSSGMLNSFLNSMQNQRTTFKMDAMILKACEQWLLKAPSPWWLLASPPSPPSGATVHDELWPLLPMIALHWSWSCDFCLQFLMTSVFKTSSTESNHLTAGLPTRRVPSGLYRVNFLQGFCSCILKRCPSHLRHPTLFTGGLNTWVLLTATVSYTWH
jgi:hypothetical protein